MICYALLLVKLYRGNEIEATGSGLSLKDILTDHTKQQVRTHTDRNVYTDDCTFIAVRRKHVWNDSVWQFMKRSFDPKKPIRIVFIGEEAVDGGGPRREYFHLLCLAIKDESGLFHSQESMVNFRASMLQFQQRQFHLVGLMVATSLLHGGPPFPFLPECVYNYIANLEDVANPECEAVEVIKKVSVHVSNARAAGYNIGWS